MSRSDSLNKRERYDSALTAIEQALQLAMAENGVNDTSTANCLVGLGNICFNTDNFGRADSAYHAALAIREQIYGLDDAKLIEVLDHIAELYSWQGQYARAEPLRLRALTLREKANGPDHPEVAVGLNYLALLYRREGKFTAAISLNKRALAIREKAFGPIHSDVAMSLNNLAVLYVNLGRYAEAEPLYKRALSIGEKTLGPNDFELAAGLAGLARLYTFQGRFAEAEPLLLRALAIEKKVLAETHPNTAATLNNLGGLYFSREQYAQAESLFQQALTIYEKIGGPDHPEVAFSLNNIARTYVAQGKYAEAEPLLQRSVAIFESALGADHPDLAASLANLGRVCAMQSKYAEAKPLLERSLAIRERALGTDHPEVAASLIEKGRVLRTQDSLQKAEPLLRRAVRILRRSFQDNGPALAENDALRFARTLKSGVDEYLTCYFDITDPSPDVTRFACDLVVASKGQVSEGIFQRQQQIVSEHDSATQALAVEFQVARFQVSRLFTIGPGQNNIQDYRHRLDSLSAICHELESQLSLRSSSYRRQRELNEVASDKVAAALPPKSILLEYIRYGYHRLDSDSVIPHYAAALLGGSSGPMLIDLGEATGIETNVTKYRDHFLQIAKRNGLPTRVERDQYRVIAREIYDRIVRPVAGSFFGKDLIFISPDASLNLVSFAGLVDSSARYFAESNTITYLSAARDLLRLEESPVTGHGLLALGDPDFDATVSERADATAQMLASSDDPIEPADIVNTRASCEELGQLRVSRIPRTADEVRAVAGRWRSAPDADISIYTGAQATEDRFKREAPGKRLLHVATHGYFLEARCFPQQKASFSLDDAFAGENPLLLSGLLLAGANLHGKGCDSASLDDGVLSALEVSSMDLRGTDLVVLSACETGLGNAQAGEGVYGLCRAFQLAGARTLVTSLWPVDDATTAAMMKELYDRTEQPLSSRIRSLQLDQLRKLRRSGVPDDPFLWASFIAQGDWR